MATGPDRRFNRENRYAAMLSVGVAVSSYAIHQVEGTTLIQDNEIWASRMQFASEYFPIASRHFTTQTVYALNAVLGLSFRTAFAVHQYVLYFLLGLVSFRYLRTLGFSFGWSMVGELLVLTSYPVLCAFFIPVYTWDDFWQYLFSILAFWLLFRGQSMMGAMALALGALAREASIVLWPVWVYAVSLVGPASRRQRIVAILMPLVAATAYILIVHPAPDEARWHVFTKNFYNAARAQNSAYSFLVSFGFLWITGFAALVKRVPNISASSVKRIVWYGAAYAVPAYTALTMVFGLARETRLFFPPFLFLIPLSLWFMLSEKDTLRRYYLRFYGIPGIVTALATIWAGIELARLTFPDFEFRGWEWLAQTILGIHIGIVLCLFIPVFYPAVQNTVRRLLQPSSRE